MIESGHRVTGRRIVVLTGAGISAESGLPTFRDASGHWGKYRPEDLATPQAFARHPEHVLEFYTIRRRALLDPKVVPNAAHLALADFERRTTADFLLVTQNVDNLHERAVSLKLVHLHGKLLRTQCAACGHEFDSTEAFSTSARCSACAQIGGLRPAVVWFGEQPVHMEEVTEALERCDLFIAIGTSGSVYPAAGFGEIARKAGAHTVEINPEDTPVSPGFTETIRGLASRSVPVFLATLV